jgi:cellobiose-specific phosphotransferase system component IIB
MSDELLVTNWDTPMTQVANDPHVIELDNFAEPEVQMIRPQTEMRVRDCQEDALEGAVRVAYLDSENYVTHTQLKKRPARSAVRQIRR